MPDIVLMVLFLFTQAGDVELGQNLIEEHAVTVVEARPRDFAFANLIHRRGVAGAPTIGEVSPVDLQIA
jgi:hypothetical protein